jgi:predicted dehydrogenase
MLLECSHEIDLALWCGAPHDVRRVEGGDGGLEIWLGDQWCVLLADWDPQYRRIWAFGSADAYAECQFTSPEALGVEMYREELAHFLACICEGRPTDCTLADGLATLEVCADIEARRKQAA